MNIENEVYIKRKPSYLIVYIFDKNPSYPPIGQKWKENVKIFDSNIKTLEFHYIHIVMFSFLIPTFSSRHLKFYPIISLKLKNVAIQFRVFRTIKIYSNLL